MTFADLVNSIIWYINGFFIPFVFALAFLAFLWGVFLYLFYYEKDLNKARNIILGGVVTLAIMVSLWGILSVLRNSLTGSGAEYYYNPFGSTWDEWFGGALNGSDNSQSITPNNLIGQDDVPLDPDNLYGFDDVPLDPDGIYNP